MSLIITLVIGGIVGWLASRVMKTDAQMGWLANVVVGVAGSMLGFGSPVSWALRRWAASAALSSPLLARCC